MNPFRALPLAERQLLLVAAVAAVALLSLYVQLLHESMARGAELRETQFKPGIGKSANATAPRKQPALASAAR